MTDGTPRKFRLGKVSSITVSTQTSGKPIGALDIKRINTNLQPRQNIFSADSSAESVANTIKIYYGVIELLTSYAQNDTIFSSSTLKVHQYLAGDPRSSALNRHRNSGELLSF